MQLEWKGIHPVGYSICASIIKDDFIDLHYEINHNDYNDTFLIELYNGKKRKEIETLKFHLNGAIALEYMKIVQAARQDAVAICQKHFETLMSNYL